MNCSILSTIGLGTLIFLIFGLVYGICLLAADYCIQRNRISKLEERGLKNELKRITNKA